MESIDNDHLETNYERDILSNQYCDCPTEKV